MSESEKGSLSKDQNKEESKECTVVDLIKRLMVSAKENADKITDSNYISKDYIELIHNELESYMSKMVNEYNCPTVHKFNFKAPTLRENNRFGKSAFEKAFKYVKENDFSDSIYEIEGHFDDDETYYGTDYTRYYFTIRFSLRSNYHFV